MDLNQLSNRLKILYNLWSDGPYMFTALCLFLTISQSDPLGDVDDLMLNRCTLYYPIKHLLRRYLHARDSYKMLTYPFLKTVFPHLYVYDVLGQI